MLGSNFCHMFKARIKSMMCLKLIHVLTKICFCACMGFTDMA